MEIYLYKSAKFFKDCKILFIEVSDIIIGSKEKTFSELKFEIINTISKNQTAKTKILERVSYGFEVNLN